MFNADIIVALIGILGSTLIAWIGRSRAAERLGSIPLSFRLLALGVSFTALVLAVFNFSQAQTPQLTIKNLTVLAYTEGNDPRRQDANENEFAEDDVVLTPKAPDKPDDRPLTQLRCDEGYSPIAAWHEVIHTHPGLDTMQVIDAIAHPEDGVSLRLQARAGKNGHARIEVMLLCSRGPQDYKDSES